MLTQIEYPVTIIYVYFTALSMSLLTAKPRAVYLEEIVKL